MLFGCSRNPFFDSPDDEIRLACLTLAYHRSIAMQSVSGVLPVCVECDARRDIGEGKFRVGDVTPTYDNVDGRSGRGLLMQPEVVPRRKACEAGERAVASPLLD